MDRSYSYSQLVTAFECQAKYKYMYVDKLEVPEEESLALHFGTAMHAGLNSLLEGGNYDAFNIYMDSLDRNGINEGRHSIAGLRDMGNILLDRFARLHLKKYEFMHGETRLFGELPNRIRIEGTPDAIVRYDGKITLLDFKTSSTRYDNGKIRSSDQLRLYTYLAQNHYNIRIEQIMYVVFIKTKEPSIQTLVMNVDQIELAERIYNIMEYCTHLETRVFFTRNHNACFNYGRKCKFFDLCHPENKG